MANAIVENGKTNPSLQQTCEEIKHDYEEAYSCIDRAIKLDEEGKTSEALHLYEFGLNLIERALGLPLESPLNPDLTWEKTYLMIQKMRKTKKEIQIRISELESKPHPDAMEPPPSYEEAMAASPSPGPVASTSSQMPGPSNQNIPYVPPSAVYDHQLVSSMNQNENSGFPPSYAELNSQLKDMEISPPEKEVIYSHDNVRLYFISPDGRVSATSQPDTLIIGRIRDPTLDILDETLINIVKEIKSEMSKNSRHRKHRHHHHRRHRHHRHHHRNKNSESGVEDDQTSPGRIYLQVGSWIYPLIPEVSPCYRTEYGAYILPDVHSGIQGAAVGIQLPEDADQVVHQILDKILNGSEQREEKEVKRPPRKSKRSTTADSVQPKPSGTFSTNLVKGATYIANNLVRGAGSTARFIDFTTPRIIDKIQPEPQPKPINPTVRKSFEVAKTVSGKAVDVTDYLATKIGLATSALGRYLAPHIQKQGTRLLTSTTSMSEEEASKKINSVLDVTSGAVESVATVYSGLETAAGLLGKSLSNNTVQIIEYKYGQPAGALTNDALSTVGNVYTAHHNYHRLKPKGIAKAAAKGAGNAVLEDFRSSYSKSKPHEEFQGPGPGDGSGFLPPKKE